MKILQDQPLRTLNTFGFPARARYFCRAESVDDLRGALAFADTHGHPILILGGGSSVVLSRDSPGLYKDKFRFLIFLVLPPLFAAVARAVNTVDSFHGYGRPAHIPGHILDCLPVGAADTAPGVHIESFNGDSMRAAGGRSVG